MDTTAELVSRAKDGDREAWSKLVGQYYDEWLEKHHGRLGTTLRLKFGDTVDLLQSAIGTALRDLPQLENDDLFYTWMNTVIRRKIPAWRRRLRGREATMEVPEGVGPSNLEPVENEVTYEETLDGILDLFPSYPRQMAAVVWHCLDDRGYEEIGSRLDLKQRRARDLVKTGLELLGSRLGDKP